MKMPILKTKNKAKEYKGNMLFSKVLITLIISIIVLNRFNFVFANSNEEDVTIIKYNDNHYSDYKSAYEDIQFLIKTRYPKGEGRFMIKKVGNEWQILDGLGDKNLIKPMKVEPHVEKVEVEGKTKYINGYKLTCKVKNEIETNHNNIIMMNFGSTGSVVAHQDFEWESYCSRNGSRTQCEAPFLEIDYDRYSKKIIASMFSLWSAISDEKYQYRLYEDAMSGVYWARFVGRAYTTPYHWVSVDVSTDSYIIENGEVIKYPSNRGEKIIFSNYDGSIDEDYYVRLVGTLYLMCANNPPTTPSSITVPSYVKGNTTFTVSWGASTDADRDSITYKLERQVNGGSWTEIYSNTSRNKTETVQSSWNTIRYRVRAYDGKAYSDYRTSNIITVDRNNPTLNLTQSPTNWTNKSVTITANASDVTSGVKRIQRPDGTWLTGSSTTYTVSSNDSYTFTAEDNAGNITTKSISIENIDKIPPTIDITENDNNWHKAFTININHSDSGGSGIATRRYKVTNDTTKPTSDWIDLTSENQDINILTNGNNYVHVHVIDNAGNETYTYKGSYKIDNAAPNINSLTVEAISQREIKITTDANDNLSGLHTTPYMYNRDNIDITDWVNNNILIDNNLKANKQYSYKYKAKDNLENISDYSNEVKRYTLALDPVKVKFIDSSETSVTLEIDHNMENENIPEVRIFLRERGTSNIVSTSNWNTETTRVLTGLQAGKEYEVYLTTRNGDNIENPEVKAPLVDTEGNPIDYVVTVVPVSNFRVIESSVSSLTVSWDQVDSQEYQVYLKDELGNEIQNTRSSWIADKTYTFSNLPLPNTKYLPYIITRKSNSTIHLAEKKVLNEERAYTDAENLTYATYEPFSTSIKITLDTTRSKNPSDTQYMLRNDINGATETVTHSNPIWENINLKEESYYTYSVKVINKNGKPTDFFKLIFKNGEPHTLMPDIEIPDLVNLKDYIDLDRLKTWDYSKPIDYFLPTELNNKYVKHNDIIYFTTREQVINIENDSEVNALYYAVSDSGYGYTRWRELDKGYFNETIEFNYPGKYKVHFIFKSYNVESEPVQVNYFIDWIKPTIKGESAIKGQTAVTGDSFTVNIEVEDNVSPYLFYSIDDGNTWYLLKKDLDQITFHDIIKSKKGIMNTLKITICDINSNTTSKTFTVWGIENQN